MLETGHTERARDPRDAARRHRRLAYELRETSRALSDRLTVRTCGVWCAYGGRGVAGSGVIDLVVGRTRKGHNAARATGTHACGSVWECPVCKPRIVASRAVEVTEFAREARARGYTLRMVTATLRHGWTDELSHTSDAVSDCWGAVLRDRGVRELRAREGWDIVTALEVTHGANGWHPHLHAVIAINEPTGRHDRDELRRETIERAWISACARIAGENNIPIAGVAIVQSPIDPDAADYLTKLGLEIADDSHKETRRADRSSPGRKPFEILADARAGDVASARLWQTYARAMVGARQLRWGHGVRKKFGLSREPDPGDIALERADVEQDRVLVSIEGEVYRHAIGRVPGLLATVLDALERYGVGEALAEIAYAHGAKGDEVVQRIIASHRWVTRCRQALYERAPLETAPHRERLLEWKRSTL